METVDKFFENVHDLDLIFHVNGVHSILAEMVTGGNGTGNQHEEDGYTSWCTKLTGEI